MKIIVSFCPVIYFQNHGTIVHVNITTDHSIEETIHVSECIGRTAFVILNRILQNQFLNGLQKMMHFGRLRHQTHNPHAKLMSV